MAFKRIVTRRLPDGRVSTVFPFHISLEGMESTLLCRDEDDYDMLQKCFHVSCWKSNVIVIEDIEMSNHGHLAVLAENYATAECAAAAIKKNYSQYLANRYGQRETLSGCDIKVLYLDTDWYARNALAYIARNAIDTGQRIEEYKWSSYRAYFCRKKLNGRPVSKMSRREMARVFRTHSDLSSVPWRVDDKGCLIPASACDCSYLEDAFNNDQAFFLKTIGIVNCAEMHQKLVDNPRTMKNDSEFILSVNDTISRWWNSTDIVGLSLEKKTRLIPYLYRTNKTSVAQLARCIQLSKDQVESILRLSSHKRKQ